MPAQMPDEFIAKPLVQLAESTETENYIAFSDVIVDQKDHSTYIEKSAQIHRRSLNTVEVERREDRCHLVIIDRDTRFKPREIPDYKDLMPVASVSFAGSRPERTGAKMPSEWIKPPEATFSDMQGEFYVSFADIVVDQDQSTYIRQNARIEEGPFMGVKIRRDSEGVHVILDRGKNGRKAEVMNYKPQEIADYSRLISVHEPGKRYNLHPRELLELCEH